MVGVMFYIYFSDLEWKVVYVGSAYNSSLDQTLDSILVGPIPVGRHQFVFEVGTFRLNNC